MKENKENCLLKQKLKKENIKREMYVPPVSDFAIIFHRIPMVVFLPLNFPSTWKHFTL